MTHKNFSLVSGAIFLLIAILHALRIYNGWPAQIGAVEIPVSLSWVALVIAGYLAYQGLSLGKK
ncbi:MAG: hypothetical protein HYV67_00150 [Candidatus Taylorbacteria bacterium]|nr:hypothetical protein [Candidatus Taylorbacteria bacterium]